MKSFFLYTLLLVTFTSNALHASQISQLTFAAWNKPDVKLLFVMPKIIDKNTEVLFIIHGASRDVDGYLDLWIESSKEKNVILVAPHFTKTHFPHYSTLGMATHSGNLIKNKDRWLDNSLSNFYSYFKNRYNLETNNYRVFGFSGGSQFAHRYLMYGNDKKISRAALGSAGWYTFINNEDFPYGIKDMPLEAGRIEWLMSNKILFFLGDEDNDPNHSSLNTSVGAMNQGSDRYERGLNYFDHLIFIGEKFNIPFRWNFKSIKGTDHNREIMSKSAMDFMLSDLEYSS